MEYVVMPAGSSSDRPASRPGPMTAARARSALRRSTATYPVQAEPLVPCLRREALDELGMTRRGRRGRCDRGELDAPSSLGREPEVSPADRRAARMPHEKAQ